MSNHLNLINKNAPNITKVSKRSHTKILKKLKIKQFENPIFEMDKAKLLKHFGTKRSKKLKM